MTGIDLSVTWLPADGVGGDCFDTLGFGNVLGVSIADIAGKGLPAALLMSNLQAAVRAFAQEAVSPASINNSVNRLLCRNMASGRFATFCYARIEPAARPDRLLQRRPQPAAADPARRRGRRSSATAAWSSASFRTTSTSRPRSPLAAGDRLLFYTDGITEARNPEGDEYGEDRLADAASPSAPSRPMRIKDAVLADVNAFTNGKFEDDATLIVVGIAASDIVSSRPRRRRQAGLQTSRLDADTGRSRSARAASRA